MRWSGTQQAPLGIQRDLCGLERFKMATACVLHVIACAVTRVSQLVRVCLCVSPPAPLQATASCCTASAACGEMLRAAQQQHQPWSRLGSWPAPGAHSKCILPWGCFLGLVHVYTCTWCHRVPPLLPRPRLPPFLSPPLIDSLTDSQAPLVCFSAAARRSACFHLCSCAPQQPAALVRTAAPVSSTSLQC